MKWTDVTVLNNVFGHVQYLFTIFWSNQGAKQDMHIQGWTGLQSSKHIPFCATFNVAHIGCGIINLVCHAAVCRCIIALSHMNGNLTISAMHVCTKVNVDGQTDEHFLCQKVTISLLQYINALSVQFQHYCCLSFRFCFQCPLFMIHASSMYKLQHVSDINLDIFVDLFEAEDMLPINICS